MMKRILLNGVLAVLSTLALCAQSRSPELSGYLSGMPSVIYVQPGSDAIWQGLLHNRINFGWQFGSKWRTDAALRTRLIVEEGSTQFKPAIDRLSLTYEHNRWKLQLGRQRINWGQTLVWNPNDLFNTYSFFDFDYPERPGSDGLRLTYYHNETASSELATTVDCDGRITAALMHHWNAHGFDYQLIFGELAEDNVVVGGAWSGNVKGLNFRSEASCFLNDRIVAVSAGLDYAFSNSLMLQTEVLYNNVGTDRPSSDLLNMYDAPLSAMRLSICQWSWFGQCSYPLTSRLNGSLNGMWFADIDACYGGLTLDYSLGENLDLSAIAQYFASYGDYSSSNTKVLMAFARLKWSF